MRRKILAFLLTLTLALLISCGGETENRILTNIFRPELLCKLADRDYIGMEWQDGKLFAAYLTESELNLLVTDGKVSDESALALPDAPGGGVYPQCFTLTPDGNPVVIFSISSDGQSLPETFAAVYAGNEIAEFTKLDGFLGTVDFVSADDEVIYAASGNSIALTTALRPRYSMQTAKLSRSETAELRLARMGSITRLLSVRTGFRTGKKLRSTI